MEEWLRVMENKVRRLNIYLIGFLDDRERDRGIFE